MVAIRVYPGPGRPYYLKKLGQSEGVFVRVGSTNRRADSTVVAELSREARNESFDEQPMPELDAEAIDFRAASELFAPVRKLKRSDLRTLRLTTVFQGREVPTVGGVLLFAREREQHFPDAWIQVGRFAGANRRHILDSAELHGALVPAVDDAIAFVRRNISREAARGSCRLDSR